MGQNNERAIEGQELLDYLMSRFNMSRERALKNMSDHGHELPKEETCQNN